jgi:hypothetical protein
MFSIFWFVRRRVAFDGFNIIQPAWVCNRNFYRSCVIEKNPEKNY